MDRFWSKVDASGDCWEWTGYRTRAGYGQFKYRGKTQLAHRVARTLLGLPNGENTDHLCRNKGCINPDHTEDVSIQENLRRGIGQRKRRDKTHCIHGHPRIPENLGLTKRGRYCRVCKREQERRRRWALRQESV